MARILVVGIATLDIINTVAAYPPEDSEVRARAQAVCRGGNAANTAVVLAQSGHHCHWAGVLANDVGGERIRADLMQHGVNLDAAEVVEGHTPTSYVTLNAANGSRTIVHFRDLPEYRLTAFLRIELDRFDWIHFEGRHVHETRAMLDHVNAQYPGLPHSVELEKPRPGIDALCAGPTLLLYSRGYVRSLCEGGDEPADPEAFLTAQQHKLPGAEHVCSWAEHGAWGVDRQAGLWHSPAQSVALVVDTLGAGDTFNAALIAGSLAGRPMSVRLRDACHLAGSKCAQQGIQGLRAAQ